MNQRFEDYIKDYNSNFSEISKCANSKGIVAKYYSSTKGRYKKFFPSFPCLLRFIHILVSSHYTEKSREREEPTFAASFSQL